MLRKIKFIKFKNVNPEKADKWGKNISKNNSTLRKSYWIRILFLSFLDGVYSDDSKKSNVVRIQKKESKK